MGSLKYCVIPGLIVTKWEETIKIQFKHSRKLFKVHGD